VAGDFTSTIVTRFELETSAQNAALAETSGRLEKVAKELEKSTDGFDKLRSNVDATTDRLRIFGTRARGLADAIDDHIRDPVERARIALQHFERISNRAPNKLDKLNDAVGRGRVQWEAFKEQLGPMGQLIGGVVAGAVLALAVAIGKQLVDAVQAYIKSDKDMQASVSSADAAWKRLQITIGKNVAETLKLKDGIDGTATALDALNELMTSTDDAAQLLKGAFRAGFGLPAFEVAISEATRYLNVLRDVFAILSDIVGYDPGGRATGPTLTVEQQNAENRRQAEADAFADSARRRGLKTYAPSPPDARDPYADSPAPRRLSLIHI
jgi:hypothetical protein